MTFTPRRKLSVGEKTKGTSKVFTLGSTGQTSYDTFLNDAFKVRAGPAEPGGKVGQLPYQFL